MSVITQKPKPLLLPYLSISNTIYNISVDLGIINVAVTTNATWTLPSLELLKHGAFLYIDNKSNFTVGGIYGAINSFNGFCFQLFNHFNFAQLQFVS